MPRQHASQNVLLEPPIGEGHVTNAFACTSRRPQHSGLLPIPSERQSLAVSWQTTLVPHDYSLVPLGLQLSLRSAWNVQIRHTPLRRCSRSSRSRRLRILPGGLTSVQRCSATDLDGVRRVTGSFRCKPAIIKTRASDVSRAAQTPGGKAKNFQSRQ